MTEDRLNIIPRLECESKARFFSSIHFLEIGDYKTVALFSDRVVTLFYKEADVLIMSMNDFVCMDGSDDNNLYATVYNLFKTDVVRAIQFKPFDLFMSNKYSDFHDFYHVNCDCGF